MSCATAIKRSSSVLVLVCCVREAMIHRIEGIIDSCHLVSIIDDTV